MSRSLELLNAYLDGKELSPAEEQALSQWVNDPDNAKTIVELAIIHSHIQHWMSVPSLFLGCNREAKIHRIDGPELVPCPARPKVHKPRRIANWYLALAASLMLAVVAYRGYPWNTTNNPVPIAAASSSTQPQADFAPEPVVVATVTEALEVRVPDRDVHSGTHIQIDDKLVVESGILAFTTNDGSRMVVEAPAELRFGSARQIFLDSGKLTARVEGGETGLVVVTPTARVIDLGTEFGVAVGPQRDTRVAVYEGVAELYGSAPTDGAAPASRRINAGRAGYVASHGELMWTVQTLPYDREFIRPDEIESIRRARHGSAEATQQVSFFTLQRTPGLLGYQSFDMPSRGERYAFSFKQTIRADQSLVFGGDLSDHHLYSSGSLVVGEDEEVFLDLDTSADSPLARAGVLTEQGHVGRSGSELWLAWKSRTVYPQHLGSQAGLALMFGDQRLVQEPLFFGYSDNRDTLSAVVNIGSRINHMELDADPNTFAIDHLKVDNSVKQWVVQIIFGERSDKVAVWCDVPFANIRETRPFVETMHNNILFDRIQLRTSEGGSPCVFDDIVMASNLEAIASSEALDADFVAIEPVMPTLVMYVRP
ncbi:FecR family protein [Aeoliella mucimassa]|uniref:FecR protein n=1 Tax=Aeoliella mucimassa TaxID=2527972 RepID=A0A518AS97_9BACT|nr:FecR family protein [Aeoliella mucimassa]QDU57600.1 FecR protein [Aeoliella mucimassa]